MWRYSLIGASTLAPLAADPAPAHALDLTTVFVVRHTEKTSEASYAVLCEVSSCPATPMRSLRSWPWGRRSHSAGSFNPRARTGH